jgi:hypothetical protein
MVTITNELGGVVARREHARVAAKAGIKDPTAGVPAFRQ